MYVMNQDHPLRPLQFEVQFFEPSLTFPDILLESAREGPKISKQLQL